MYVKMYKMYIFIYGTYYILMYWRINLVVDDGVHGNGDAVLGEHLLGRHIERHGPQVHHLRYAIMIVDSNGCRCYHVAES